MSDNFIKWVHKEKTEESERDEDGQRRKIVFSLSSLQKFEMLFPNVILKYCYIITTVISGIHPKIGGEKFNSAENNEPKKFTKFV